MASLFFSICPHDLLSLPESVITAFNMSVDEYDSVLLRDDVMLVEQGDRLHCVAGHHLELCI